jgi:hypothetical protein
LKYILLVIIWQNDYFLLAIKTHPNTSPSVSLIMFGYITRFLISGVTWQKTPRDIDLDLLAAYSVLILAVSYYYYLSTAWIITLAIAIASPLVISKVLK